jgi:hypothetical protein
VPAVKKKGGEKEREAQTQVESKAKAKAVAKTHQPTSHRPPLEEKRTMKKVGNILAKVPSWRMNRRHTQERERETGQLE